MEEWQPDIVFTDTVIDGRLTIRNLNALAACWVVADLTHRGYSAAQIGEQLGCTPRHVKRIRARDITSVMLAYAHLSHDLAREQRKVANLRGEIRRLRG